MRVTRTISGREREEGRKEGRKEGRGIEKRKREIEVERQYV